MLDPYQPHEDLEKNESHRSYFDISVGLKEEDNFVKNILDETRPLGESLKEGEENIIEENEFFLCQFLGVTMFLERFRRRIGSIIFLGRFRNSQRSNGQDEGKMLGLYNPPLYIHNRLDILE